MSEWLREHAWKACVETWESLPWVRIPLFPPTSEIEFPSVSQEPTERDSLCLRDIADSLVAVYRAAGLPLAQ